MADITKSLHGKSSGWLGESGHPRSLRDLSSPAQHWNFRYVSPHLAFYIVAGGELHAFMLMCFTNGAVSLVPYTELLNLCWTQIMARSQYSIQWYYPPLLLKQRSSHLPVNSSSFLRWTNEKNAREQMKKKSLNWKTCRTKHGDVSLQFQLLKNGEGNVESSRLT